jgi:hypothetical protein
LARYSGQLTARQASSSAALLLGSILLLDEYCKSHNDGKFAFFVPLA